MHRTPPHKPMPWKTFQPCLSLPGTRYPQLFLEWVIATRVCNYTVHVLNYSFSLGCISFRASRVCYHLPWLFLQNLSLPGQVINPADLTYQMRTFQLRRQKKTSVAPSSSVCRYHDPFYQLDLDPRDFTTNSVVLSEYLSEMGKIQGRAQTYLTAKNQRLLGKTIRRAKMMGVIPHLSILTSVERRLKKFRL